MRTLPIVLAAAGAISLLAAAAPAKADWDDHWHPGWGYRDWRAHEWREHEWREHHHAWWPGYYRPWHGYYRYGYAPPVVVVPRY